MKGKLVVIEGIDGSGKTTQLKLLLERLKKDGHKVKTIHFPQHGHQFFGVMVDQYLTGKFGDASGVDPHLASVLYACDRWEAKPVIDKWLEEGCFVVLDRYMTSNKGHQLGKISSDKEKKEYLKWLDLMEYETFKIPRPDIVFYLDVPIEIALSHIENRSKEGKGYSKGDKDQHENMEHLVKAKEGYSFALNKYDYWKTINCASGDLIRSKEDVHNEIFAKLKESAI
jgi:dTMP kinase